MRRKYQHPAPLTMNMALDTRLLDLVAQTYSDHSIAHKKQRLPRSLTSSQKFSKTLGPEKDPQQKDTAKSPYTDRTNHQRSHTFKITKKSWHASLKHMPVFQPKGQHQSLTQYRQVDGLTFQGQLQQNIYNIDNETTKHMVKNIRKNILSSTISPEQAVKFENIYRLLVRKMQVGAQGEPGRPRK